MYTVTPGSAKNNTKVALKKLRIHLQRVDERSDLAKQSLNKDLTSSDVVTTASAKRIKDEHNMTSSNIVIVKIHQIEHKQGVNDNNIMEKDAKDLNTTRDQSQEYSSDTDSTISYELLEKVIGTIYFLNNDHIEPTTKTIKKLKSKQDGKSKNSQGECEQTTKILRFKCESKRCTVHTLKCRDINAHFRTTHKRKPKCKKCKKSYDTPYSLKQQLYNHSNQQNHFCCKRCGKTFPFRSQLHIHSTKHTCSPQFECSECSLEYK